MLTIAFGFPAGRYHATAWDHHANEGTVEWPPSPWRITRALVAASYKLWPAVEASELQRMLEPLLALPSYRVPATGAGHSRHYMPTGQPGKPVKIFDAFVAPAGELVVHWPAAELDAAQQALLARVLAALTYLGRAESWVEARLVDGVPGGMNCEPDAGGTGNLSLHAVVQPAEYAVWRDGFLAAQHELAKKDRRELPATWWDILHVQTDRLFRDGWSSPPGVRRASYLWDPAPLPHARRASARSQRDPTVARFACSSAVLPRLTEAISVGDRLRSALLSRSHAHPVFVGRQQDGATRAGHGHAYFAPSDDDADGYVDHCVVHARDGFDEDAVHALQQLRELWGRGDHKIFVTLIALGEAEDFGGLRRDTGRGVSPVLGPRDGARIWESHTPFVPPRHAKRRHGLILESPEHQARAQLANIGIATEVMIEPIAARQLSAPHAPNPAEWYRFRSKRPGGGGARGAQRGYGFRLTFAQPVRGPISIGYGAHQGLGQFVAIE